MVIDTGSELSWLHCNNHTNINRLMPDPFFSTRMPPPPTRQSRALRQPAQFGPEIFPYPLPATRTTSATPLSPTSTLPLRKGTSLRTH
ncbi:hypothetical protein DEO72_LG5g2758 [Vigna unguiculata]|uniref:Peptidase A1 domain-containing protein n=1 Tax=Vigna unguiculata TaxID=3917 RepID=A0A4D6M1M4_VIGUN|nr:hypothetical protein DEO72_LG5g2758 [Vigna unguiculata]